MLDQVAHSGLQGLSTTGNREEEIIQEKDQAANPKEKERDPLRRGRRQDKAKRVDYTLK